MQLRTALCSFLLADHEEFQPFDLRIPKRSETQDDESHIRETSETLVFHDITLLQLAGAILA